MISDDPEHRKAALDALTFGLRALKAQIAEARSSLALTPTAVRRLKARLERWRAAHSALSCEQGQARLAARQAEWDAEPSGDPREVGYQAPVTPDRSGCPDGCGCDQCVPPFCACGRRKTECDGSRAGCPKERSDV